MRRPPAIPSASPASVPTPHAWDPDSWRSRPAAQQVRYRNEAELHTSLDKLRSLPPLVTSWEIERLRALLAEAQEGKRFLLQGGDCAESLAECRADAITSKLKILLQMSLVLVHASKQPVIRVGRFAGQYAKPRSSPTETRTIDGQGVTLPSYFGDIVNRPPFTPQDREPDPSLLLRGYEHAALTLNFIRSLVDGGFADLHHPEYWNLGFLRHAELPADLRAQYERMCEHLADGLRFMEALGEARIDELTRVEFFTSHEALLLDYESAQTRTVPRRDGWYNLSTHLPWIGERTRQLDGAHVEYFRGIRNPIGIKLGPDCDPVELLRLVDAVSPHDEPGRLVLITRLGAKKVDHVLPRLIGVIQAARKRVLWVCDPMHANGRTTPTGIKTRHFDDILHELRRSWEIHREQGSRLGGVHFELTGDDVTECLGGASGITEDALSTNYQSQCDPRLNYEQALEMAFLLSNLMSGTAARPAE
ncbi:MAG: 3-deoxy-7-phosphoheptulonate synthase class II [Phycisphaerales bacterium]|jgi:3-deoxy-7-phosphoheptulonate synthase|nr:3-deoxy-7-phosphoheptulonate synthase class II [Phycisphaerales bacterium]